MTLKNALNFFESLRSQTSKKSEIKIYDKFIHVLTTLRSRGLSGDEIQSIETALDDLDLERDPGNGKKHFKKALTKFEKYLKDRFSLIPQGYYTNIGIGLGSSFGILFGVVALSGFERSLGISLGLVVGMLIGLIVGSSLDAKAHSEGRTI